MLWPCMILFPIYHCHCQQSYWNWNKYKYRCHYSNINWMWKHGSTNPFCVQLSMCGSSADILDWMHSFSLRLLSLFQTDVIDVDLHITSPRCYVGVQHFCHELPNFTSLRSNSVTLDIFMLSEHKQTITERPKIWNWKS